ncbi:MAG TPA: 30S ribosomal protein S1 [Abditibacteriaceae bacterium]|jgi:4-hydroxy-3-methylbut-2-enyl diphosphate reductase
MVDNTNSNEVQPNAADETTTSAASADNASTEDQGSLGQSATDANATDLPADPGADATVEAGAVAQGTTAPVDQAGDSGNDAITGATNSAEDGAGASAGGVIESATAEGAAASEAPAAAPTRQKQPSMAQVMEMDEFSSYLSGADTLQRGSLIRGVVVRVDDNTNEVLVDIGTKSEGIVARNELGDEDVNVGDEIEVIVLRPEDEDGHPVLSKRRADYEKIWRVLIKARDEQTDMEGTVREQVKGGLIVDLGVSAFVPASHVDARNRSDLSRFVGRTIPIRVIEIDKKKNKVIGSHRLAAEKERKEREESAWGTLEKDKIVEGVVRRITDFGAFIDIGGIDGLLHVREMAWSRVEHPDHIVKKGQKLQVLILEIDEERKRVALGLKQLQSDPWKKAAKNLRTGQMVKGKVVRIAPSCAFLELEDGIEGIIPIGEMSETRINTPEDILSIGQEVEARIKMVQTNQRRITLSLKAAVQEREQRETRTEVRRVNERATEPEGLRLGDLFGEKLRAARDRGKERNEARSQARARALEAAEDEEEDFDVIDEVDAIDEVETDETEVETAEAATDETTTTEEA